MIVACLAVDPVAITGQVCPRVDFELRASHRPRRSGVSYSYVGPPSNSHRDIGHQSPSRTTAGRTRRCRRPRRQGSKTPSRSPDIERTLPTVPLDGGSGVPSHTPDMSRRHRSAPRHGRPVTHSYDRCRDRMAPHVRSACVVIHSHRVKLPRGRWNLTEAESYRHTRDRPRCRGFERGCRHIDRNRPEFPQASYRVP